MDGSFRKRFLIARKLLFIAKQHDLGAPTPFFAFKWVGCALLQCSNDKALSVHEV